MKIKCKRRIQAQTQSSQSYINAAQNGNNDLVNQLEIAQKAEGVHTKVGIDYTHTQIIEKNNTMTAQLKAY